MHDLKADRTKNRLYVTLGEADRIETMGLIDEVAEICPRLRAGFTCLIHFCRGTVIQPSEEDLIFKLQNALCRAGMGKAVYVRQKGSVLGLLQLELLHIHSECPAEDSDSIDEAEGILDRYEVAN